MSETGEFILSEKDITSEASHKESDKRRNKEQLTQAELALDEIPNIENPTIYKLLTFLDAQVVDLKNKKADEGLRDIRETALSVACGQENLLSTNDIEKISDYLSDHYNYWDKESTPGQGEDPQAAASKKQIFRSFLDIFGKDMYERQQTEHAYPSFQLEPEHATASLIEMSNTPLTEDTLPEVMNGFLDESGKDITLQSKKPEWHDLKLAVTRAHEFYMDQGSEKRPNMIIAVTVSNGKIVGTEWSQLTKADPEKGIYLFNPEAPKVNPLNMANAKYTVDQFELREERIVTAKEALNKIRTGRNIKLTPEEELALYQILDEHKKYFLDAKEESKQADAIRVLDAMTNYMRIKTGKPLLEETDMLDTHVDRQFEDSDTKKEAEAVTV